MSTSAKPPVDPPRRLAEAVIQQRLERELPNWTLQAEGLTREWRTAGWPATLMLANAIAHLAEAAWHHPEMTLSYARLRIVLSTHDSAGVTELDLALALRIEHVLSWPANDGEVLTGPPAAQALIVG